MGFWDRLRPFVLQSLPPSAGPDLEPQACDVRSKRPCLFLTWAEERITSIHAPGSPTCYPSTSTSFKFRFAGMCQTTTPVLFCNSNDRRTGSINRLAPPPFPAFPRKKDTILVRARAGEQKTARRGRPERYIAKNLGVEQNIIPADPRHRHDCHKAGDLRCRARCRLSGRCSGQSQEASAAEASGEGARLLLGAQGLLHLEEVRRHPVLRALKHDPICRFKHKQEGLQLAAPAPCHARCRPGAASWAKGNLSQRKWLSEGHRPIQRKSALEASAQQLC